MEPYNGLEMGIEMYMMGFDRHGSVTQVLHWPMMGVEIYIMGFYRCESVNGALQWA